MFNLIVLNLIVYVHCLSKKWPKMHFEEKILEKKACLHFSYKNILLKYSKNMKRSTLNENRLKP